MYRTFTGVVEFKDKTLEIICSWEWEGYHIRGWTIRASYFLLHRE